MFRRTDALLLHRARDLIEARLSEDLSVATVAHEVGLSIGSLQRLFAAADGLSVYQYLRDRRLDVARALLESGRTVAAAAEATGYSSPANFATAFRRRFGITPIRARNGAAP